jgi:3D (Asp-Asp-Asp) domain-containing protein
MERLFKLVVIISLVILFIGQIKPDHKIETPPIIIEEPEDLEHFDPDEYKVNPQDFAPFSTMVVESTAYCPCEKCCGIYSDGFTATGKDAFTKGVAVDPKVIPLGSKIEIPDYGTVYADDVGGAIKGRKVDVRFKTHQEAREYGRKTIRIRIYK